MNSSLPMSNVYYLPLRRETPEMMRRRPDRSTLRARITRAWWRVRFSAAEIWSIVRRTSRHLFADTETPLLDRTDFERFETPRVGPARIIDFETARRRLRPQAV